MTIRYQRPNGDMAIAEMKEFAGFPARTQRYIRRSLDIAADICVFTNRNVTVETLKGV